jgi:hypothetical protein
VAGDGFKIRNLKFQRRTRAAEIQNVALLWSFAGRRIKVQGWKGKIEDENEDEEDRGIPSKIGSG